MIEIEKTMLDTVKRAASEAGDILMKGYRDNAPVIFEHKGASDFVTQYDRAAERAIIETIGTEFPTVSFIGEESGETLTADSEYRVIIDPLDGTNNFMHKIPHFSVSIAVMKAGELIIGVVHHPVLDEMIWALQGQGAYLNERRLSAPTAKPLSEMLVGTCLPYHGKGDCELSSRQQSGLMPNVSGIRSPGTAALEIAYVALGRFDAFWSQGAKLEWWDIAAGIVIARESGCKVTDLEGNAAPTHWDSLLVAHPDRHGQLQAMLSAGASSIPDACLSASG